MSEAVQVRMRYGVPVEGHRARVLRQGTRTVYDDVQFEERDTLVHDGRARAGDFSLDENGFVLVRHASAVRDFFDPEELKRVYYPEVEALVKAQTGAPRVLIFDHTLRTGDEAEQDSHGLREPVPVAHNDYTERSAPQRVRDLLPDEAEDLLRRRFQIVQVWRPVNVAAVRTPLALCDAASAAPGDFIRTELKYEHRTGEIYHLGYNPRQRWVYFPAMQPDEALVFKVYDSAADGRARFTAHGAFHDPTAPADAPPRRSIEVRTLVFYDG